MRDASGEKTGKAPLRAPAPAQETLDPDPGAKSRGESRTWLFGPRHGSQGKGGEKAERGEAILWRTQLLTPDLKMLPCELATILKDKENIWRK